MTQLIDTELQQLLIDEGCSFPDRNLWSNEPPLESDLHRDQIDQLIRLIRVIFAPGGIGNRSDVYVAGNLTIYYSPNQKKSEDSRGPDVFVVLGTDPSPRRSWVVWHENGQYPNVIIELLSPSTATVDRTTKKQLYQSIWRVPEYFWFDPATIEFQGFQIVQGLYQPIVSTPEGWLWSQELGFYLGIENRRLRLFSANGSIVPFPEEAQAQRADRAEQRASQAERRAGQAELQLQNERTRSEILRAKLLELGIDPEQLS